MSPSVHHDFRDNQSPAVWVPGSGEAALIRYANARHDELLALLATANAAARRYITQEPKA